VKELARTEADIEIIWRAFELRPEPVPALDPNGEYLQRVWNSSVYPLAEKLGVVMKLPPVQPRSRLAHEAAHWARTQRKFEAMNDAVFRAFFERGEDIGEREVLVSLASDLNLDTEDLIWAIESREFEPSVMTDEEEAGMLGLGGVPAFVANRKAALSGVQPLENLRKLVEYARQN
jgi:predicted DsbA family dithiol-disulfide isomerase